MKWKQYNFVWFISKKTRFYLRIKIVLFLRFDIFLFGGHRRNDIDRDTQTSQWKQSHFIEEKHFQKHYRPISSNCRPWEDYWVAMKVSSNPLPLSHPIDKRKFDFSDPFLCHFASAKVPCKKVKFKVEKVSGKFVHICTHLVSSCLKDIKSFSFDGHWPGLQKVIRILSCCPECGLKAGLWEANILQWEETVGIYRQFQPTFKFSLSIQLVHI